MRKKLLAGFVIAVSFAAFNYVLPAAAEDQGHGKAPEHRWQNGEHKGEFKGQGNHEQRMEKRDDRMERRDDRYDRRDDRMERRDDFREKRDEFRDKHEGRFERRDDRLDRRDDRFDKREDRQDDRFDKREDRRDKREDFKDRPHPPIDKMQDHKPMQEHKHTNDQSTKN